MVPLPPEAASAEIMQATTGRSRPAIVPRRRLSVKNLRTTLAIVWRIASPYYRSEDKWPGGILLAAVIGIELASVGITVLLNSWNARFYNALQDHNWDAFTRELVWTGFDEMQSWHFSFCVLA